MSYESTRFSQPSLTQGTLLSFVCHHATYHIDACWLNVGADGAERTCHDPPAVRHFVFPLAVFRPGGAEQHGVESPPSLAAIYPSSCTWLQTSFGAQGRTCRQYCHVLMTGTETQIALLFVYYNITERAVIHYFYFWIISFTRDLMNKSTVLPKGEHFPSCWSLCGSKATNQPTNSDSFETDVMTINSGMVPHS